MKLKFLYTIGFLPPLLNAFLCHAEPPHRIRAYIIDDGIDASHPNFKSPVDGKSLVDIKTFATFAELPMKHGTGVAGAFLGGYIAAGGDISILRIISAPITYNDPEITISLIDKVRGDCAAHKAINSKTHCLMNLSFLDLSVIPDLPSTLAAVERLNLTTHISRLDKFIAREGIFDAAVQHLAACHLTEQDYETYIAISQLDMHNSRVCAFILKHMQNVPDEAIFDLLSRAMILDKKRLADASLKFFFMTDSIGLRADVCDAQAINYKDVKISISEAYARCVLRSLENSNETGTRNFTKSFINKYPIMRSNVAFIEHKFHTLVKEDASFIRFITQDLFTDLCTAVTSWVNKPKNKVRFFYNQETNWPYPLNKAYTPSPYDIEMPGHLLKGICSNSHNPWLKYDFLRHFAAYLALKKNVLAAAAAGIVTTIAAGDEARNACDNFGTRLLLEADTRKDTAPIFAVGALDRRTYKTAESANFGKCVNAHDFAVNECLPAPSGKFIERNGSSIAAPAKLGELAVQLQTAGSIVRLNAELGKMRCQAPIPLLFLNPAPERTKPTTNNCRKSGPANRL